MSIVTRRSFLATSSLVLAGQPPRLRNLVLLVADDWGLSLGCYGDIMGAGRAAVPDKTPVTFTYKANGATETEAMSLKNGKTAYAKVFPYSGQ